MNKMALTEPSNFYRLERVIKNYPELVRREFNLFEDSEDGKTYYNNLLPILTTYMSRINMIHSNIGLSKINYITPRSGTQDNRVYPQKGIGLISFPRDIRNYLLHSDDDKPLVIDFDIKNCFPTIYYQYLIKNGYDPRSLTSFKNYIDDRQTWVDRYGEGIKQEIISVLNCCQKILTDNDDHYETLIQEIWRTQNWIQRRHNLNHLDDVKRFIYGKNTEVERDIVNIAMDFANEWSNDETVVGIYAYDGFAVYNRGKFFKKESVCDFLKQLNALVLDKTGYQIEFVSKPLDVNPELLAFLNSPQAQKQDFQNLIDIPAGKFLGDVIDENIFEDFKEDIIVFKTGMGDGKTFKVYSDVLNSRQTSNREITTISILNRISLIDNIKFDYPFVYSYRENDQGGLIDGVGKSTVICSESLYRLTDNTRLECEYLILDEVMSLLPQMLCNETHRKNMKVNQENFLGLIRSAKKIIILDANISNRAIDFIKTIRASSINPTPQIRQVSVAPRRNRNIHFGNNTLSKLEASLNRGNKIFIACTRSIKFGEGIMTVIRNKFPELKTVYINSDNKGDHIELLSDTNKWAQYDVIMISPCISTGVSCVVKGHFNEVFCFFSNQSCNPLDACQQIGRIRHPTTEDVHIDLDVGKTNNKYRHGIKSQEQVIRMLYHNVNNLYTMNSDFIDTEFDYDTFKRVVKHTPRTDLFTFNYAEQSKLFCMYQYYLRQALENTYICNYINEEEQVNPEKALELYSEVKTASLEYQNERAKEIFKSPNITDEDAEYLNMKNKSDRGLSLVERHRYNKWLLTKRTKMPAASLDKFVSDNSKRLPRTLLSTLEDDVGRVVKYMTTYIRNLSEYSHELDNSGELRLLFEPTKFRLEDKNESETYTTDFLEDTHKGRLLRFLWVERILKFFGSDYLFHQIRLTTEEFNEAWVKFVDWLFEPCQGFTKTTNMTRIGSIFTFSRDRGQRWDKKELLKSKETFKGAKNRLNKILGSIGLQLKTDSKKVKLLGERRRESSLTLYLDYPILLNYYLEPEPIGYTTNDKRMLKLDKNSIPILTMGNVVGRLDDEWTDKYQRSVFYNLPTVQKSESKDRDE